MKRKKRRIRRLKRRIRVITTYILMFTVLIWSLISCSKEDKKPETTKQPEQVSDKGHETTEEGEELSFDSVVLKVGKEDVTYREILLYILQIKNQYEPSLGNGIWDYSVVKGETFEQIAKKEVFNQITELKILKQQAEQMDISINEDELFEIKQEAKDYMGKITKEDQETYGIKEDMVIKVLSDNYLAQKVFSIATNEVDTNISDDEAKQMRLEKLVVLTKGENKSGLKIDMSQEQKQEALTRANLLLTQANEAEDFKAFCESNSDLSEVEVTFGAGDDKELEQQAFALTDGQISGVIETSYGYVILKCVSANDEEATAQRKEEIIAERQNKKFDEKYEAWSSEYKVVQNTEKWDKISFCE